MPASCACNRTGRMPQITRPPARGFPGQHDCRRRRRGAYPGRMGRIILTILGAILAIGLIFTAIGWIFAMLKTFIIIALIAVVVFIVVSLLAKRRRRD